MHPLLAAAVDLVLPPVCLGCDGRIAAGDAARLVCRRCRTLLRRLPSPTCARCGATRLRTGRRDGVGCGECVAWPAYVRCARSPFLMHPPADRLVHRLKYDGWRALAGVLAASMAELELPADVAVEAALVVPVPTTAARRRERGYDQADLLARAFAARTGRTHATLLVRRGRAGSQTTLQPAARRANVAGAFEVAARAAEAVRGAHLMLVDDVLTTGATAIECARTLVASGARCASIVTFARALDARRLTQT